MKDVDPKDLDSYIAMAVSTARTAVKAGNKCLIVLAGVAFVHYAIASNPQSKVTFWGVDAEVIRSAVLFLLPIGIGLLHAYFALCLDWENSVRELVTHYYRDRLPEYEKRTLEYLVLEPSLTNALRMAVRSNVGIVRFFANMMLAVWVFIFWLGPPALITLLAYVNSATIPEVPRWILFGVPLALDVPAQFFLFRPSDVRSMLEGSGPAAAPVNAKVDAAE